MTRETRRGFLLAMAAAAAMPGQTGVSERAKKIHKDAFVFDGHVHVVNRQFYKGGNIGERLQGGQFDLTRAREGGLNALFFTLFVTEDYYPGHYETKQALRLIDEAYRQIERNSTTIALAKNATEIEAIHKQGKMAALLDLEGGFDMDGDLGVLRMLYQLGLRSVQLPAHNYTNNFADSCCAVPRFHGLTNQGKKVVQECNKLGMVINIAHASTETAEQTIALSELPVVSTHDGLRSRNNIPRLMTEATLEKLAAKGGVIGFHMGNEFHNRAMFEYRTKRAGKPFWDRSDVKKDKAEMTIAELDAVVGPQFPMEGIEAPEEMKYTVEKWFEVVERATQIAGEDHVALGTDFDGGPTLPRGMRDARDYPMLTEAMLKRGWSETRIRKYLGGNLLRVVQQVTESRTARGARA